MTTRFRRVWLCLRHIALLAAMLQPSLVASAGARADGVVVRIDLDDGTHEEGTLVGIGSAALQLAAPDGGSRSIPLGQVRVVEHRDAVAESVAGRIRLSLTDGTSLTGDDFSWNGTTAALVVADGRIEVPIGRVRMLEWPAEGVADRASWIDAVPEGTTSDLVVIGKPEGFDFVECAIAAVGPDTVTVVLDEETIPVKRSKVIGLRWLRSDAAVPVGRTVVDVGGGSLRADEIAWSAAGLLLDAADAERKMLLPAAAFRRIDYAAGRTTLLASVAPERLAVEPFFGALGSVAGLSAYFAPRPLPADARFARPGLVMQPRTDAVWRIPPGGRRFRTRLVGDAVAGPATVTITVDERRVLEQIVSGGEPTAVSLDLDGGRRLGVTVDFGPAGAMAGAVRLEEPAIEQ